MSDEKPQDVPSDEQSSPSVEEPADVPAEEQPAAPDEEPAASEEEPAASEEQPEDAPADEQSAPGEEAAAVDEPQDAAAEEESAPDEEESAPGEEPAESEAQPEDTPSDEQPEEPAAVVEESEDAPAEEAVQDTAPVEEIAPVEKPAALVEEPAAPAVPPPSTVPPVSSGGTDDSAGGRVVAYVAGAVLALAVGGYVVAQAVAGDKVPRGTAVAGVAVGGHSEDEAIKLLEKGIADRVAQPFQVKVAGKTRKVTPEQVGISVDTKASLEDAGAGLSWSPGRLWEYFTGGDDLDAAVVVDEKRFGTYMDRLDEEEGRKVRDGRVSFDGTEVVTREPRKGLVVQREEAEKAFRSAYLSENPEVTVSLVDKDPEIDEADVQEALDTFANPAVSAPVKLTLDDNSVTLQPAQYVEALSMEPVDGKLVPKLDSKKLALVLEESLEGAGGPEPATVKLVNGTPQVVPDKPGITFDQDEVDKVFLDMVAAEGDGRSRSVAAKEARSSFRTEDARKLGIKEVVSDFSTQFPYAEYRNINIGRAAQLINGTVLRPGETFSMNDTVGERTRANGFTAGFMIADGVFKEDLGGGVSQMATTLFNGMFFAGLEDVEHKPHSFYISRYPVGREATVAWGAVDLRFRNNTDHGVLIEAKVTPSTPGSQGNVRVRMWSTKVWDIDTTTSGRYAQTPPKTRHMSGPTCVANEGYGGFQVDVKRIFRKPGSSAVVKTENFHTTYTPSDTVICDAPKKDKKKD